MDTKKRLLTGSAFRTLHFFVQIAVVFVMTPFVIKSLGEDQYGLWILLVSVLGYFAALDFGLTSGVARYVSRAIGQENDEDAVQYFNTAFFIFCAIGVAVWILTLAGSLVCFLVIQEQRLSLVVATVVFLLGTRIALRFPALAFRGMLTANLRYDLYAIASMIGLLIANASIYWLMLKGHGIRGMAGAMLIAGIIEFLLMAIMAMATYPKLRIGIGLFSPKAKADMQSYSWKTLLCQIGNILIYRVDPLVISATLLTSANTFYSVGARINDYFRQLVSSLIGNLSPVFSQREGEGDFDAIREIFLSVTKVSTFISVFIGLSIVFYADEFIERWLGLRFGEAYQVAIVLCFGYTLALMQDPGSSLLYGLSKHHYSAVLALSQGVLNIVFSIALAPWLGIVGVAWGTTIGLTINILLIQPFITCKIIQMSSPKYFGAMGWIALKTAVPLQLFFYVADRFMMADYTRIMLVVAAQALVFIPVTYWLILNRSERDLLSSAFARRPRPTTLLLEE